MSEYNLLFPCAIIAPISVRSVNVRLSLQRQAGFSSSEALARGGFAAMSRGSGGSSSKSKAMCAVAALNL